MTKYISRTVVEAHQLTEHNATAIAQWCGGTLHTKRSYTGGVSAPVITVFIEIMNAEGETAYYGDYIVLERKKGRPEGRNHVFTVWAAKKFEDNFMEEHKPPLPATPYVYITQNHEQS